MKRIFITPIIILCAAVAAICQTFRIDPQRGRQETIGAFSFCYFQQYGISKIKTDFPQLLTPMAEAEAGFNATFGKSCTALADSLPNDLRRAVLAEAESLTSKLTFTEASAKQFIEQVKARAKGDIPSPTKEILLSFNPEFAASPELEFTRGFTTRYSGDTGGLLVEFSYPASWKMDGTNGPRVSQLFQAKYGHDDPALAIGAADFLSETGARYTDAQIDVIFSPARLKDFAPRDAKIIESKAVTIGGRKGAMYEYEKTSDRAGVKLTTRIRSYKAEFKGKLIMLQFMAGGPSDDRKTLAAKFEKNRALFELIVNSMEFRAMDK